MVQGVQRRCRSGAGGRRVSTLFQPNFGVSAHSKIFFLRLLFFGPKISAFLKVKLLVKLLFCVSAAFQLAKTGCSPSEVVQGGCRWCRGGAGYLHRLHLSKHNIRCREVQVVQAHLRHEYMIIDGVRSFSSRALKVDIAILRANLSM